MVLRPKIALIHPDNKKNSNQPRVQAVGDAYQGVLRYLRDQTEWDVVGLDLPLRPELTLSRASEIRRGEIAGVIISGRRQDIVDQCQEQGIPVVAMNRLVPNAPIPGVSHDDVAIGRVAAIHFLRRGIRSLAFCGPDYLSIRNEPVVLEVGHLSPWVRLRLSGFAEEAQKTGAPCSVFYDPKTAMRTGESAKACLRRYMSDMREWVRGLPRPVGILGCADTWAMDCLAACEMEGLRVPEDLAVLGVDNDVFRCDASRPSLSSVDRNMYQIGYDVAALLIRFLTTGRWGTMPILVPPAGVVERQSTRGLAVADPKLAKALRYVREHFCEPISTLDVARATGVSDSWLRCGFRQELHFSLVSEIRRLRVERARELLATSDLPLKLVAAAAGFHSETYLCDVFAKDFGVSPGEWRRSQHRATSR